MSNKKTGCSGCFTFLMIIIAIAIFCVIFVSVPSSDNVSDSSFDTLPDTNNENDVVTDSGQGQINDNVENIEPEGYLYYYRQLDSTEKLIYNELYKAAKEGRDSISFKDINYDVYGPAVNDAIYAFTYDHPIYFWITNGFRTEYIDKTGIMDDELTFYFAYYSYWDYTMSPEKYINQLNTEIDKVVALAKAYSNPFDQAVFVHDYLIHHAEYDHDSLAEARKTVHAASSEYIYSAYGCLVNKKTVCSGYAEAFQMIMNKLGVNTTVVVGDAGGAHEWNMIEIEGESYYIDITWDDSDRKNDSGVFIYTNDSEYEYMCITSEELKKTHAPDIMRFSPPNCLFTKYNYFIYKGYQVSTYSFNEVNRIVTEQAQTKKIISVRFANSIEFNKAVDDLLENKNGLNIPALSKGYKYITDDVHYTIKFLLE